LRVDCAWLTGPCLPMAITMALSRLADAVRQRSWNITFLRISIRWDDQIDGPHFQGTVD